MNGKSVYFAGDTGCSDLFKDIHEKCGDIDVCLMPISAYFFRPVHLAPEDALQASEDLGCKTFIPYTDSGIIGPKVFVLNTSCLS